MGRGLVYDRPDKDEPADKGVSRPFSQEQVDAMLELCLPAQSDRDLAKRTENCSILLGGHWREDDSRRVDGNAVRRRLIGMAWRLDSQLYEGPPAPNRTIFPVYTPWTYGELMALAWAALGKTREKRTKLPDPEYVALFLQRPLDQVRARWDAMQAGAARRGWVMKQVVMMLLKQEGKRGD